MFFNIIFFIVVIIIIFFHTDIFSFCCQLPHQSSDSEKTQFEDREGDFMDTTMGSDNLLLLASLSFYVSTADDGISITSNVANSSLVHEETVEIGEVGAVVDPSPAPSSVVDVSVVERETSVPPLVLKEVADGGAIGGDATDPLLQLEGVAGATRESIITEPTMSTFDLDPPKSRKTIGTTSVAHASIISKDLCWACLTKKNFLFVSCLIVMEGEPSSAVFQGVNVQDFMEMFNQERENDKSTKDFYTLSGITAKFQRFDVPVEGLPLLEKVLSKHLDFMSRCTYGNAVRMVMFKSFVAVFFDIECTPFKSFNLHKVLEWKDVLSELQSMNFDVGFILDWLKTQYCYLMHHS